MRPRLGNGISPLFLHFFLKDGIWQAIPKSLLFFRESFCFLLFAIGKWDGSYLDVYVLTWIYHFCVDITCLHDFCRISLLLLCLCDSIQLLFPNACDLLLCTKLSEEKVVTCSYVHKWNTHTESHKPTYLMCFLEVAKENKTLMVTVQCIECNQD